MDQAWNQNPYPAGQNLSAPNNLQYNPFSSPRNTQAGFGTANPFNNSPNSLPSQGSNPFLAVIPPQPQFQASPRQGETQFQYSPRQGDTQFQYSPRQGDPQFQYSPRMPQPTILTHAPDDDQIVWEWADDDGWREYDKTTSSFLEAAYKAGADVVPLTYGWFAGKGYEVSLTRNVQHNTFNNNLRNIRRKNTLESGSPNPRGGTFGSSTPRTYNVVWEWRDDNREWVPYDATTNQLLEEAHQRSDTTLKIRYGQFAGKDCRVDLRQMIQNTKKGDARRDVRRKVIVASLNTNQVGKSKSSPRPSPNPSPRPAATSPRPSPSKSASVSPRPALHHSGGGDGDVMHVGSGGFLSNIPHAISTSMPSLPSMSMPSMPSVSMPSMPGQNKAKKATKYEKC